MFARAIIALFALAICTPQLQASPRADLLFAINAALESRDGASFAHCFNFRGADEATRQSLIKIISQILAWPSFYVFTSERSGEGSPKIEQDGKSFTLNGDWKYQVHIFVSKSSKQGFVFPAGGTAEDKDLILLTVPLKSAKER